ncbi:methionine synthase reductase [Drosophila virilis]|uniref:Methionine synthase reductase n=1 Tax=Drosophila virilis TaxID=7244 RepID=B4LX44_DROVI|nr:methionine synthase reductase [Drosophila virilis]EDW66696.1 uncharacterized protein Dvir_GJ23743, isoform A [Drosophila virilis]KRF82863.1 uncharacterized protein Dvir_GJ23743, isoform B [Drosophila virilis]
MVGVEHINAPLVVDIDAHTLTEYVPAKPLESNLEVVFGSAEQGSLRARFEPCAQLNCGNTLKFPFARGAYKPTAVTIKDAQVLVAADAATETKRVVELTLDTAALGQWDYAPGDTVAILPSNAPQIVAQLLQRLNLSEQADSVCHLSLALNCAKKSAKVPGHIPATATPRELLTHCLSLHAVPQKQFLSALASCTSDSKERSFLASLSSKQGAAHYQTLILERGLCLLDLLELCTTCQPTLALLVEHLPRLLPRPYSIANSPLECSQQLRIIYSIRANKAGVTTSMLEAKRELHREKQQSVQLYIYPREPNAFRYTDQEFSGNQILIAVGTGLAPFLGFLAHKQLHKELATGQTWLYVGAKMPQAMVKQQQLLAWQKASILQSLRLCYSRHSTGEQPKYVQQLLEQDAQQLVELMQQPTTVLYVCADGAKITKCIEDGLRRCLQLGLKLDEMEATQWLKEMRAKGKYREDIWL